MYIVSYLQFPFDLLTTDNSLINIILHRHYYDIGKLRTTELLLFK